MSDLYTSTSPPHVSSIAGAPTTKADRRAHRDQPRIRRRNRLITSCLECRRRKLKCDKLQPCTNCTKFSRPCVFIAQGLDPEAQAKLAEVKEKMGMLERTLEEDISRKDGFKRSSKSPPAFYEPPVLPGQELGHSDQEDDEEVKELESTHLALEDASYYEDDANDDIVDLGISMGRLRITERIGGLVRPRFSEELAQTLKHVPESDIPNPFASQPQQVWMSPGSDYVAPSSNFIFGSGVEKASLMTYLPSKTLVDKLLVHYWQAVHVIAHAVHRPSFERQYDLFWKNVSAGVEPRVSFQAVLFAALLSSIISMSEEKVLADFGVDRQSLVDNFKLGTESALARAGFLRTTKLETLQAFVMYLIPLCRAEVSRAHSALTGTCIRLAECMGLHRDPTTYSTDPIEIQLRRLLWFHIAFLDIRTCEATGPRPQIRRDEYDTRFPLNVDDEELDRAAERGAQVKEDSKHFTDMTITRMRFECFEMHRVMWTERPNLQKRDENGDRKTTVTSLLSRIQSFKAAMEKTYLPMLNKSNPQHALAMEMYNIASARLYINVLHPFASNDRRKMPERLRQMMFSACLMIIEHSMTIEQQPALQQWAWYLGALHQYHVALLMLSEMYVTPPDPVLSARIWRCADFTFELPPGLASNDKIHMVFGELAERTSTYASIRRMRAPTNMPHAGPRDMASGTKSQLPVPARNGHQRSFSGSSNYAAGITSPPVQHQHLPQQPQPQQQQQQQQPFSPPFMPPNGPIGAIPQVDWGSVDLGSTMSPPSIAPTTEGTYSFGGFAPSAPAQDMLTAVTSGPSSSTISSPAPVPASIGSGGSGTGASPMEAAINEIDWNEWEKLFGGAQMGAGNVLIPPFTFPSFEPSDAQWQSERM